MNPEVALRAAGFSLIAGVDEAGRGAYAGPLVVAAVILDLQNPLTKVGDSKTFSESERSALAAEIKSKARAYSIIVIEAEEIDTHGLHPSNLGGMRRAITALAIQPDYIITDGYHVNGLDIPSIAMWRGDQVSDSVGAASIVAKDYRDQIMMKWHHLHPEYGFATHKGYGTALHQRAIEKFGVLDIHRKCFAPIRKALNRGS
ncbi:MAG: ribonuclease HII [Actinobacteria bacterium]|uniref:Ribonuclease HII n=1 Tax=Candidatus Fonsibacter lacus TaxID=2576439 RepID=A0A965LL81_9PROT|nr:ribonuclease HII [Candidatus Fonsibacter lacus]